MGLGIFLTLVWIGIGDELEPDFGEFDGEDPPYRSWVSAPLRAWRRRERALHEVSTNPFSMGDEQLAMAAYQSRMAPYKALWGILGGILTAAAGKKIADR